MSEQWGADVREGDPSAVDDEPGDVVTEAEVKPQFGSCEEWVTEWLLPLWTRDLRGANVTWCPQWHRHPEAVHRLSALWMAWEELTAKPGSGPSLWWVQHADHHLAVLLDQRGPFHGCTAEGHRANPMPQLPSEPSIPTA